MQTDTNCSLSDIKSRYQGFLVPELLKIQKCKTTGEKSLEWARNLRCLTSTETEHKRIRVADGSEGRAESVKVLKWIYMSEGQHNSNYVAVSYTWEPSQWEDADVGGYMVESVEGSSQVPSKVRDVVLKRVTTYAEHHGASGFWIDKECIDQDNSDEKQIAMNSMDLVYSTSDYPLGLLTRPIEAQGQLNILLCLLRGEFINELGHSNCPTLKPTINQETALDVLRLLEFITSDPWWNRAWIFQEEYRSSVKMELLIPYSHKLKVRHTRMVGNIPGELQVSSVDFRSQATMFCLAYLGKRGQEWQEGVTLCNEIIEKAGKYNILLKHYHGRIRKSMSPTIFADIGRRKITNSSDFLPIAANCCYYPVRLDKRGLENIEFSLSLCILVLYLLNGEILRNNRGDRSSLSGNIFEYLKRQSLDDFDPPVGDKELTFIKHCRFSNVRLSIGGIITSGRLWKLCREIDTTEFSAKIPPDWKRSRNGLSRRQRSRLRQLSFELKSYRYKNLANDLYTYLDEDAQSGAVEELPSKMYLDLMAQEVVQAIEDGKRLQLGSLVNEESQSPYRGIFVRSASPRGQLGVSYVFTAWEPRRHSDDISGVRVVDKYVSLEVDMVGRTKEGLPQLETKRWINGLCFFSGSPPRDVIFPWPVSIRGRN